MTDFDEFIDRLKTSTNLVTDAVGKATKSAVSKVELKTKEAKLRYAIHETEERMQTNFAAIGKSVYEQYKKDEDYGDFDELFGRLDALADELNSLKKELSDICELNVCLECNAVIKKSDCFCPKCGAKIKNE